MRTSDRMSCEPVIECYANMQDPQPKNATSEDPQLKSKDPPPKNATSETPQPESSPQLETKKEDVDQPTFLQRLVKLNGFIMSLEEQNKSVEEKLKSLEKKCDKIMVKLSANRVTDGTKAAPIEKQIQLLESFKYLAEKYLSRKLKKNERKLFEEGKWEKLGYEVTVDGVSLRRDSMLFDSLTIHSKIECCRQGFKEIGRRVDVLEKDNAYLKIEFAKRKEETECIKREQEALKTRVDQIETKFEIVGKWLEQGWKPHKEKYEERMKQQKRKHLIIPPRNIESSWLI